jgi:hypothetical protein
LTHWLRYIETAKVSKLAEGPSSDAEPSHPATVEARVESAEKPIPKTIAEQPESAMSLLQKVELPKVQKTASITPKRRRMASVLDAVMESTKILTPASAEHLAWETEIQRNLPKLLLRRLKLKLGHQLSPR